MYDINTNKANWLAECEQWFREPQLQSYGSGCDKMILEPVRELIDAHLPSTIYKLCPPDGYGVTNLKNNQVSTNRTSEFNDPFDTLQFLNRELNEELIRKSDWKELLGMRYKALYDTERFLEHYKHYGLVGLQKFVENVKKENWTLDLFAYYHEHPEEYMRLFCDKCIEQMLITLEKVRNETYVSCFTTSIDNMLMWSHYANKHTGFALGYDLTVTENKNTIDNLYPVFYSDKKIDVTLEVGFVENNMLNEERNYSIDKLLGIKSCLFKSADWAYEEEWRLAVRDLENANKWGVLPLKASEIYYGCRICEKDRQTLHEIALLQGLREYQMRIDPYSESYDLNVVQC